MIEISIALVIIASIAGFLVNKYLDMQGKVNIDEYKLEFDKIIKESQMNIKSLGIQQNQIADEFSALKLKIGLRGNLK
jgi:C4-dicarboxylate transporter